MEQLNAWPQPQLLSPFQIREGDSPRAVSATPEILPDILWRIDPLVIIGRLRIGIGYGNLEVFGEFPDEVDGPAYHAARAAREDGRVPPGAAAFRGFPRTEDDALTALSTLLAERRRSFTPAQREAVAYLRDGVPQVEAARQLGIAAPTFSKRAKAAQWTAHQLGEQAMRRILGQYSHAEEWRAWTSR